MTEIEKIILDVQEEIEKEDDSIYLLQSHRRRIAKAISRYVIKELKEQEDIARDNFWRSRKSMRDEHEQYVIKALKSVKPECSYCMTATKIDKFIAELKKGIDNEV